MLKLAFGEDLLIRLIMVWRQKRVEIKKKREKRMEVIRLVRNISL